MGKDPTSLEVERRRIWKRAKAAFPDSDIYAGARTDEEHARNIRVWKKEHPESAIDPSAHDDVEFERDFRLLKGELT